MTTESADSDADDADALLDSVEQARSAFVNDLTAVEVRVIGCLVEKESTTPDNYPLSTNALTSACNQKTSRDPVMDLNAADVDAALLSLRQRKMVRAVHVQGSRATKHRHVFGEAAAVSTGELALLAVLFLRSAQTIGELRSRSERIHEFDSTAQVEDIMRGLTARGAVRELPRQPGQSATRWEHLAGSDLAGSTVAASGAEDPDLPDAAAASTPAPAPHHTPVASVLSDGASGDEVAALRAEVRDLSARLDALQGRHDTLVEQLGDLLGEPPQ